MDSTNRSLLNRLKRNPRDEEGWRAFVEIYNPFLRKCFGHLDPRCPREDLVQEVMKRLFESLARFEHNGRKGAFRAWLGEIARRSMLEFLRADKRFRGEPEEFWLKLGADSNELERRIEADHDAFVSAKLLRRARANFSERDWNIFYAYVLDKSSPSAREIAEKFKVTQDVVFAIKARILKWLREEALGLLDA